jgi:hypothetical protein
VSKFALGEAASSHQARGSASSCPTSAVRPQQVLSGRKGIVLKTDDLIMAPEIADDLIAHFLLLVGMLLKGFEELHFGFITVLTAFCRSANAIISRKKT